MNEAKRSAKATSSSSTADTWERVQNEFGRWPGQEGIELRRRHYARYFLRFAPDVVIESGCTFSFPDRIVLDDDARLNLDCIVYGSGGVWIGRHARIGPRCFIHSANHETGQDDPRAYYERGYEYRRVTVGDNVLVSANVSILPGATLGDGCFVACGAVVPGKRFAPGGFLTGVPARSKNASPEKDWSRMSIADIAIVTPAKNPRLRDAVRHLLMPLGLPQVRQVDDDAPLSRNVQTVLTVGGATIDRDKHVGVDVWTLCDGEAELDVRGKPDTTLVLDSFDENILLPGRAEGIHIPYARRDSATKLKCKALAFWLQERLTKQPGPLTLTEFLSWLLSTRLLHLTPRRRDRLLERILIELQRRVPDELSHMAGALGEKIVTSEACDSLIDRCFRATQALFADEPEGRVALRYPAVLVWRALSVTHDSERDRLDKLADKLAPALSNSLRLVAFGLSARYLGWSARYEQVCEELADQRWWPQAGCIPRMTPGRDGLLVSPMLLAWWLAEATEQDAGNVLCDLFSEKRTVTDIIWRGFTNNGADETWTPAGHDVSLVDEETRRVSCSLLENWITLHNADCMDEHSIKLSHLAYNDFVSSLERLWTSLFARMLGRANKALVKLSPWPGANRAALSIRYDVDRPVTAQRVRELVELQAECMNAPCASWYFKLSDGARVFVSELLQRLWQETGVHAEAAEDFPADGGVTHHSAPTSQYWQGNVTTAMLEAKGVSYGEFLANALPTPRATWTERPLPGQGHCGHAMLSALHFPLEGSTLDETLDYFDRLLESFRRRLQAGGHAIIASHPDLDQTLLAQLVQREELSRVWFASVQSVIDRVKRVMSPDAVRIVGLDTGVRALVSSHDIADLTVDLIAVDGTTTTKTVQLLADRPRSLDGL